MRLKFLGTGTSQGIPVIGSTHPVCLSTDSRDKRLRTSALLTLDQGEKILIDCGPDFRQQMLMNNENQVNAVLITHEHNDHVIGLDDLRPLIFLNNTKMPIYCLPRVGKEIIQRFPYAFADERYPGAPSFTIEEATEYFSVCNEKITSIKVMHAKLPILGYKFKNSAYITDAKSIDETEKEKLKGLDTLVINCLRKSDVHHSHYILPEIFALVEELKPKMTYLTHISHHLGFHRDLEIELPSNIQPAYDGLEIEI